MKNSNEKTKENSSLCNPHLLRTNAHPDAYFVFRKSQGGSNNVSLERPLNETEQLLIRHFVFIHTTPSRQYLDVFPCEARRLINVLPVNYRRSLFFFQLFIYRFFLSSRKTVNYCFACGDFSAGNFPKTRIKAIAQFLRQLFLGLFSELRRFLTDTSRSACA